MNNSVTKTCYFCSQGVKEIDYKNQTLLLRFLSPYATILPRKKTNLCALHQRRLSRAIKRARQIGLLPFVEK